MSLTRWRKSARRTYHEALGRVAGLSSKTCAFGQRLHSSILAFVHTARLAEQNPGLVATLSGVALLDGRLEQ